MLEPKGPGRQRDGLDGMLRQFFRQKYGLHDARKEAPICPDIVALSGYINQSLSDSQIENIKTHLARCSRCRIKVESALDAIGRFELGDLEKVPDDVSFDIGSCLKKLHNKDSGKPPKK